MKHNFFKYILTLTLLSLANTALAGNYKLTHWEDLIPASELKALTETPMPDSVRNIQEGSAEDKSDSTLALDIKDPVNDYEKALISTNIRSELNNKKIRLPGYLVPIETDQDGNASTFFIVPYYGACIHVPPPPPNQIIFARDKQGIPLESFDTPYWFEITLYTKTEENEMATAAYSATVDKYYKYQDGDEY